MKKTIDYVKGDDGFYHSDYKILSKEEIKLFYGYLPTEKEVVLLNDVVKMREEIVRLWEKECK